MAAAVGRIVLHAHPYLAVLRIARNEHAVQRALGIGSVQLEAVFRRALREQHHARRAAAARSLHRMQRSRSPRTEELREGQRGPCSELDAHLRPLGGRMQQRQPRGDTRSDPHRQFLRRHDRAFRRRGGIEAELLPPENVERALADDPFHLHRAYSL